jgi:enoyl-CoA hydratase/carnithine racemase
MNLIAKKLYFKDFLDVFKNNNALREVVFPKKFQELKNYRLLKTELINNGKIMYSKIDNPKSNGMSPTMILEMINVQSLFFESNTVGNTHIFKGEDTNKFYCAGGDLKHIYKISKSKEDYHIYRHLAYYAMYLNYENFWKKLEENNTNCRLPHAKNQIQIWNGAVMGGGLCFSIYSPYRICTETTLLAMPEAKFGGYANGTFPHFISKFTKPEIALLLSLFSYKLKGLETYLLNFSTHFILNKYIDEFLNEVNKFEQNNIDNIITKFHEQSINEVISQRQNDSLEEMKKIIEIMFKDINLYERDFYKVYRQLENNLENKLPDYYKLLKERSVLCLKINFDLTLSSYDKRFDYIQRFDLESDYNELTVEIGELFEGMRAFFVEKDNKPRWKINTLQDLKELPIPYIY